MWRDDILSQGGGCIDGDIFYALRQQRDIRDRAEASTTSILMKTVNWKLGGCPGLTGPTRHFPFGPLHR